MVSALFLHRDSRRSAGRWGARKVVVPWDQVSSCPWSWELPSGNWKKFSGVEKWMLVCHLGKEKKKKNPSHLSHEITTLVMLVESDTEKHHRYSSKLFLLWGGLLGWLSSSSEVFPVWFSQIRWKKLSVRERSALRHAFPKWRKSVLIVSTFILGETLLLGIHSQIVCSLPCNVQLLEIFSVTVLIY